LVACTLIVCCVAVTAFAPTAYASALFEEDGLLEIGLSGPISSTIADREQREERRFVLTLGGVEQEVWLRVRGKSRSREKTCEFPPLRLRFENAEGVFAGNEELKLVTHCRNGERGEADAMEEFVAYRAFTLFSPASFRVRPVRIAWSDSDGRLDEDDRLRHGFLIEPAQQVAARTGGTELEVEGVRLSELDLEQAALVYVFQYMIGNTDWSMVTGIGATYCCHNGVLFEIDGRVHYVPYDFDLAGLVSTPYAKPDPSFRLRNVRQRRYRGFCTDSDILSSAIKTFVEHEEDVYQVVRDTPGLDEKNQEDAIDYLAQFFKKARDEEKLQKNFEKSCIDT
jgi:hypothetical protein